MNLYGNLKYLFVGVKPVLALPMTKEEYNQHRGWEVPENEDPNEKGYLVEYMNGGQPNHAEHVGYISWSPADVFKESYRASGSLRFGDAVELLKEGVRVARAGWNGKGMFVVYQKGYPQGIPCNKQTAEAWGMQEGDLFKVEPYLQIRMANGSHAMWVPSVTDVLAEDWVIVGGVYA
ncbi:DUF2829 domain-containing protein [Acinetobacter baumannii]|nr:DUF2829 domain-containing protein [Acinetobacter baumannii]